MPVLLAFLLLIFAPLTLCAEPPDMYSFAASLAEEGDHYRAITEYKRFLHYHPQDTRAARAQLAIAQSLYAGERWSQGDAAAEKVWQRYPESDAATQARRLYADSAFDRADYPLAQQRYQELKETSAQDAELANFQIGRSLLEERKLEAAEQSFSQLPQTQQKELAQFMLGYRALPRKSPHLAGTLSAILPGAGQLYTERPKQAAVAFALNAAFIYGAIEAWNNENYSVAGILSLFEIGWYGGNIYNAMNNAHKINREREDEFKQQLQQRAGLSLGFRDSTPWLQARFHF
ncbi:hypothetical protein SAMN02745165_03371 [Malonomonas rubra DSM 5091]|uniref:DUF5683 domain-containing protein n=1 Tax=Malonomonas rubra DSM 5091 TaxID=1122189 RepID=A0A1M6MR22_MALRU|nr:tetratricopeptide repeat protein [Malonomonas rubra]SHJ85846.1 hypothetical protein SAMN02745165_03371 [Malonomonas rubra DSM 5091]